MEPIIEGDIACWFAGVSVPSVLRPSPNEGYFTIVTVSAGALSVLHPADGSGNEGQTSQQISNLDLHRMYHHQERPIALIWNWGHDEAFWEMKGEFAGRWPSDWRHLGKSEVEAANDRYSAMAAVFDELCDRDSVLRAVRGCSEECTNDDRLLGSWNLQFLALACLHFVPDDWSDLSQEPNEHFRAQLIKDMITLSVSEYLVGYPPTTDDTIAESLTQEECPFAN